MSYPKSYSPVCITARAAETGSPPPFNSSVSKKGRPGDVVVRVGLGPDHIPGLEFEKPAGAGSHRAEVRGRLARPAPPVGVEDVTRDQTPTLKAWNQTGVGSRKTTFTAWSESLSTRSTSS